MSYLTSSDRLQNYAYNIDTSFTKQPVGTTLVKYNGTEVTYTPISGASNVVFECMYQTADTPDEKGSYICTRLQYSDDSGASWTTLSGAQMLEGSYNSQSDYVWHNFLYVFILNAWTGERMLRLAGRAYSGSTEYTVGRSYNTSSEGVGSCPHISVYSVLS